MNTADTIVAALERHMAGERVAYAATHKADTLPIRHVFEVSGLRGELFAVICHVTDDGGRLIVDIEPGQSRILDCCGFEDDAERGNDWLAGEAIRSYLKGNQ